MHLLVWLWQQSYRNTQLLQLILYLIRCQIHHKPRQQTLRLCHKPFKWFKLPAIFLLQKRLPRIIRLHSWINYRLHVHWLLRVHVLDSLRGPRCHRNYLRWWVHVLWLLLRRCQVWRRQIEKAQCMMLIKNLILKITSFSYHFLYRTFSSIFWRFKSILYEF